ncbi:MAG: hypothetical protein LBQ84_02535 [Flavobacteriaceae bacterium]|jgi:hypothetical protein|nr:hypothetical protein [Flavobacteriaceae bacterium]
MKSILIIITCILGLLQIQGQNLEFKHSGKILLDNKRLSRPEVIQLMESIPEAQRKYRSGKTLRTVGDVTFFGGLVVAIGGVLLNIYTTIGDEEIPMKGINYVATGSYYPVRHDYYTDEDYTLSIVSLAVGGAMLVATIPLKIIGKKKIRQSVEIYNASQSTTYLEPVPQYEISMISNNKGIGLKLTF